VLFAHLWLSQKVQKKSQNSKKQGFPYYFFLLIEEFGSGAGSRSIPRTNGSGSGRPKNMWIRLIRIRIHNTDRNESTNIPISRLRIETKPKRFNVSQNLKWNVSIYSKNFGTKPKLLMCSNFFFAKANRFYLFQKCWKQTKTF
jgi:hypothetical protein